jgi:hypothetical protein
MILCLTLDAVDWPIAIELIVVDLVLVRRQAESLLTAAAWTDVLLHAARTARLIAPFTVHQIV